MEYLVPGFVFVQVEEGQQDTLRILLVRPTGPGAHWIMPQAKGGESEEGLFSALRQDLFSPKSLLEPIVEANKTLTTADGKQPFQLVRVVRGDINPQFESERYLDARWASFEEAFHISSGHNETVLRWAERLSKKLFRAPQSSEPLDLDDTSRPPEPPYLPVGAALA